MCHYDVMPSAVPEPSARIETPALIAAMLDSGKGISDLIEKLVRAGVISFAILQP
jgi:hypothetical protein